MDAIVEISNRLMDGVNLGFKRSLIERIDWSQRLIEIRGSRGVGKTTLLLQKSKELKDAGKHVIYASLDLPFFSPTVYLILLMSLQNLVAHMFF